MRASSWLILPSWLEGIFHARGHVNKQKPTIHSPPGDRRRVALPPRGTSGPRRPNAVADGQRLQPDHEARVDLRGLACALAALEARAQLLEQRADAGAREVRAEAEVLARPEA